jgi:hypothetical protein
MLGTEDATRFHILPMSKDAAVARRQPAVMPSAHHAHLAVDAAVLSFEADGLARIDTAAADAVPNASLLVELALGDGAPLRSLRRGLCNGDGRRRNERRHKCKLRESHGCFSFCGGGSLTTHTQEKHRVLELVFNRKVEGRGSDF